MKMVSKIMRVGGSYTLIIPPDIIKEMKLIRRELVVIEYTKEKMDIRKLNDIIDKKNKG